MPLRRAADRYFLRASMCPWPGLVMRQRWLMEHDYDYETMFALYHVPDATDGCFASLHHALWLTLSIVESRSPHLSGDGRQMDPSELLRPWRELSDRLQIRSKIDVAMVCSPFTGWSEQTARKLECVELLALLALTSVDDFHAALAALWDRRGLREFSCATRVGLQLTFGELDNLVVWVTTPTAPKPWLTLSDEYVSARRQIERMCRDQEVLNDGSRHPEIPVEVACEGLDSLGGLSCRFFTDTMAALTSDGVRLFKWLITTVSLKKYRSNDQPYAICRRGVDHLNQLMARGVAIQDCPPPLVDVTTSEAARSSYLAVKAMFNAGETTQEHTQQSCGLLEVVLDPHRMDKDAMPPVLSAVASLSSLSGVSIFTDWNRRPARTTSMQWVGLALFSSLALHQIEHITLGIGNPAEIPLMFTVLQVDDPLAVIYDQHAASIQRYQHLRARASRFMLLDPASEGNDDSVVDTRQHTGLRVISRDEGWWSVLLPAWGRAWVRGCDVEFETLTSPSDVDPRIGFPSVHTLVIMEGLLSVDQLTMLRDRCPNVKRLEMTVGDLTAAQPAWFSLALSFPSLRELTLHDMHLGHYNTLVDAFVTRDTTMAPLERLELSTFTFGNLSDQFVQALSDSDHPIARCLEKLTLNTPLGEGSNEIVAFAAQLVSLLRVNNRLMTLVVYERAHADQGTTDRMKQDLLAFDGTPLPFRSQPLGLREKLAFLSVVQGGGRKLTRPGAGVPCVCSHAITPIFDYAANCRRRHVFCEVDNRYL